MQKGEKMLMDSLVKKGIIVLCIYLSIGLLFGSIVIAKTQSENSFVSSLNQPLQKIELNTFEPAITTLVNNEIISQDLSFQSYLFATSKTVHVKSYTRKDGTYVSEHYRRPPRKSHYSWKNIVKRPDLDVPTYE